jgi:hypothetical protein
LIWAINMQRISSRKGWSCSEILPPLNIYGDKVLVMSANTAKEYQKLVCNNCSFKEKCNGPEEVQINTNY